MRFDVHKAAEARLAGLSRAEIAAACHVQPRTVSRHHREIAAEVERLQATPREARAQDALVSLLNSENEAIRLAAAQGILRAGIQRVKREPEPVEPPEAPPGYVVVKRDPIK